VTFSYPITDIGTVNKSIWPKYMHLDLKT